MSPAPTITVGGVNLEAVWFEPKEQIFNGAADLVLLHEGLGCVALWRDIPQSLADRTGRRVFAYSRRGYGGSDPFELPRPVNFMHHEGLQVLPSVLDAAGINRCILIGHSDGGSIALINAGGARDPRVEAIVTIAAHVFNEQICVDSIRAAKQAYDDGDLRARLLKYHGDNVDCAFRGWNDVWLAPDFWHWNIEEFLAGIRIPLLAMQGEADEYGTKAQLETITGGVSGIVDSWIIPGAKHSPHLQASDAVLDRIAAFLKTHG
ncbi:MAG: alpha/beta hydrolase [Proteobacteria bacterium]|nr:alpha/beta hydrolase [Pseudomonadota bacterium]